MARYHEVGKFLVDGRQISTAPDITWSISSSDMNVEVLFEVYTFMCCAHMRVLTCSDRLNERTVRRKTAKARRCAICSGRFHTRNTCMASAEMHTRSFSAASRRKRLNKLTSLQAHVISCKGLYVSLVRGTASGKYVEKLQDTGSQQGVEPLVVEQSEELDLRNDEHRLLFARMVLGVLVANLGLYRRHDGLVREISAA